MLIHPDVLLTALKDKDLLPHNCHKATISSDMNKSYMTITFECAMTEEYLEAIAAMPEVRKKVEEHYYGSVSTTD